MACCFDHRLSQVRLFIETNFSKAEVFTVKQALCCCAVTAELSGVHEKICGVGVGVFKNQFFGHVSTSMNALLEPIYRGEPHRTFSLNSTLLSRSGQHCILQRQFSRSASQFE